jgi:hypothetical protein
MAGNEDAIALLNELKQMPRLSFCKKQEPLFTAKPTLVEAKNSRNKGVEPGYRVKRLASRVFLRTMRPINWSSTDYRFIKGSITAPLTALMLVVTLPLFLILGVIFLSIKLQHRLLIA